MAYSHIRDGEISACVVFRVHVWCVRDVITTAGARFTGRDATENIKFVLDFNRRPGEYVESHVRFTAVLGTR